MSVYCWYAADRSGCSKTTRAVQYRQTRWPSIAPVASVGKCTPSFSYAL